MKIGVIADAHGNLAALEAVRDAITAAAPDLIINLGDLVSGPFDPAGSAELQMRAGYLTMAGITSASYRTAATAPSTFWRGRS